MNKFLKKITVLIVTACMALFVGALAACGEEPADGITYSVTVTDAVGNPVSGVKVKWASFAAVETDASGIATKVLEAGDYEILLSNLPENYQYSGSVTATESKPSVDIQLTTDAYIVVVLYPDGTPAQGVNVGWCGTYEGATCSIGVATDANGVVMRVQEAAEYHIRLEKVPEGYTFESSEENSEYYSVNATAENRIVTVNLIAE